MKVWVTKYWATKGVYQVNVDRSDSEPDKYVWTRGRYKQLLVLGRDAFTDGESAKAWLVKSRDRKVKSLEKKLAELKAIQF
jgi:hypothetical protein